MVSHPSSVALALALLTAPLSAVEIRTAEQITGKPDSILEYVSNKGTVFAGSFTENETQKGFRYSAKDGFQELGDALTPAIQALFVDGMSDDGSTVFGHFQHDSASGMVMEAFIWTKKQGFQRTGLLAAGDDLLPGALSPNKGVLAGQSVTDQGPVPFAWTRRDGLRSLSSLFPDFPATAGDIAWISNTRKKAWIQEDDEAGVLAWTRGKTPVVYRSPVPDTGRTVVTSVAKDGRSASGFWTGGYGLIAVVFRQGGTAQEIVSIANDSDSMAIDSADNGRVVIGHIDGDAEAPFTPTDSFAASISPNTLSYGYFFLSERVAGEWAEDIGAWTGMLLTGISEDATVLLGEGTDPEGISRSWAITVPKGYFHD